MEVANVTFSNIWTLNAVIFSQRGLNKNDLWSENVVFYNCSTYTYIHWFYQLRNIWTKNLTYINNDISKTNIPYGVINMIDVYGLFNCSDIIFINNTVGIGYAFGVQTFA